MNLKTLLDLLPIVGSVVAQTPEFAAMYDEAVKTLHPDDQQTAKEALADIQADNDEGHARLQEKLKAAAAKG